jgi:tetratricopeptide (TPR) repeat protein
MNIQMNFSFKNSFLIITKSVLFLAFLLFTSFHITISAQTVKDPDGSVELANQVKNLYKAGNWEAGKKLVDEGMKKYPKESDLKMLSGRYYHHQKQYDKARYELKKSLEWNTKNVDAKQILVNVEQESKRYSSAICYVNELLEVNPYWKGLWNRKIELYELQGNTVEANRLRKRLSHIYPKDSKVQE